MEMIEGWLNVGEGDESAERAAHLERVRAELRTDHPRLTDTQIDLIAALAVEVRFTREHLLNRQRREAAVA